MVDPRDLIADPFEEEEVVDPRVWIADPFEKEEGLIQEVWHISDHNLCK